MFHFLNFLQTNELITKKEIVIIILTTLLSLTIKSLWAMVAKQMQPIIKLIPRWITSLFKFCLNNLQYLPVIIYIFIVFYYITAFTITNELLIKVFVYLFFCMFYVFYLCLSEIVFLKKQNAKRVQEISHLLTLFGALNQLHKFDIDDLKRKIGN